MRRYCSKAFIIICTLRFVLPVFADLNGLEALRAVPIMANESMPKPIMGVGVDHNGTVYVTETIRQQREEISLIQSPFLHRHCMALDTTEAKRKWILENYASNIIGRQGVKDYNKDGKIDVQDLSVRSEKIYTLQDSDGDGVYDKATLFAEGFNDLLTGCAHSVAPIGGHVYATIIPDLWKLTDSDGDGVADRRESLAHGFAPHIGYGNHDLHSILQGYDGKLYWSMGDRGANVLSKEGKRVSNPHSGCILRCNPDGSEFEIFAHGLRNCQYFDFDNYGNLFAVDHDADFQGERERLVYLPEGSDSGWRMYYQYRNTTHVRASREDLYNPWLAEKMWVPFHAGQPSHILPAIENSWNAPASFSFQPGTALGGAYKDHFLLGCKGNIRAFKMVADGAGFKREGDHIPIQGLGWQVLTSTFGPDGRLFFTLWKPRGNRSQLWALQASKETTGMVEVKALLAKGFSSFKVDQLLSFLGHADRRIRLESQFELANRKETKSLRAKAIDSKSALLPRLHALWGLGQLKARDRDLLKLICQDKDAEMRAQAARWAGDLGFDPDNLVPGLLRDPSPRVRLMAGIACGKLMSKDALEPLTKLIVDAGNKETVLRHAGIFGLAGAVSPRELKSLSEHSSEALRIAAVVALRRQGAFDELTAFLNDASPQVMSDAMRAIYDEASPQTFNDHPNILTALATSLDPSRPAPVNVRAIAANRRLGTIEAGRRVAAFLTTPKLDPALRVEALYSLESWPDASTLDPMDGRHFPVPQGNPEVLGQVVGPEIWSLAHDSHDKVSRRVIALLRKIEPSPAQLDRVAGFVLDEKQRSSIRIEWLRWLRKQKIDLFSSVGVQALASKSVELRVAASQELIGAKRGRGEVAEYVMGALQKSSDSSELQQAIKMVQRLPTRNAIVTRLADELFAGTIAPEVQLEVFEVAKALSKQDKVLEAKLEKHQAKITKKGAMATYGMSLVGGNAEKGRRIFQGHAQAQCAKCHALKQTDKQVGPSLEGIAKRHPREYLLRSIVDPQADLVPGYGIITLQLKNAQTVAGNLISRDDQSITVKLPDGSIQTIARYEVKSESKPIGTMPDVRSFLDPRQVRDLVAYLATLK
jgi:quinoprotein glucose dehydrogenase